MGLPRSSRLAFTADLEICRLLAGMWQVSGAHGRIDRERALTAMVAHFDAGFMTFDLADHYGPAEDLVGEFRRRLRAERGEAALARLRALTKWVPEPGPMTRAIVERAIDTSLARMDAPVLDLLQFHWWDYGDLRYLNALGHLADLRDAGKIRGLALTNFDTEHLEMLLDRGIRVVSNQVQYSLVDRRPEVAMSELCRRGGVLLLTYGTMAGGFFAERYLGRAAAGRAIGATSEGLAQTSLTSACRFLPAESLMTPPSASARVTGWVSVLMGWSLMRPPPPLMSRRASPFDAANPARRKSSNAGMPFARTSRESSMVGS